MRKVRTHKFNGVKFDIKFEDSGNVLGRCDWPHNKDSTPALRINCEIGTKEGLVTLIHECLHAENWAATEEVVDRTSTEIGDLLWRLGYRRQH